MKNKLLITLLLLILLTPVYAKAASVSLSLNCPASAKASSIVACTVTATPSGADLKGIEAKISISNGSYSSFVADGSWVAQGNTATGFVLTRNQAASSTVNVGTLNLQMPSTGSLSVSLNSIYGSDSSYNTLSGNAPSASIRIQSEINTLSSLTVSNCNFNFHPNTTTYQCGEVDINSITISATATDGNAKVTGTGTKNLVPGANNFSVVVTAESGAKKTYTIRISRKDNRDSDSTLSSLKVDSYNLDFSSNKTEYNLEVPNEVSAVNIEATTTKTTSKASGLGVKSLTLGQNRIVVTVTAENGTTTDYVININRLDAENVPSTTLTTLTINGTVINIPSSKIILYGVDSTVEKLELTATTNSKSTTYKVVGNEALKEGINIITITVSDTNQKDNIYTIIVNKLSANNTVINTLNNLTSVDNHILINNKTNDNNISYALFQLLKNKSLTFNSVNEYNGLYYSVILTKDTKINSDTSLSITKSATNPLTYMSSIPANAKIKLFIDDLSLNGKSMKLYGFNPQENSYELITDAITIKDYYIEFTSNGSLQYILTNENLNNSTSSFNVTNIIIYVVCFLGGAIIATGVMFIIKLVKSKKKNISQNPPVYPTN